jgi:general L-amino acid transport system permease protein
VTTSAEHQWVSARKPPPAPAGALAWLRANLFSSPLNIALTILSLWFLVLVVPPLFEWAILDAAWRGTRIEDCPDREAACWVFVGARWSTFVYGSYPAPERWRVDLVFALGALGLALLMLPRVPGKARIGVIMLTFYPALTFGLLLGGWFGLRHVPTTEWGGLMLTLVVAVWAIATSIPLGLLLALGRRSPRRAISWFCVAFIEFWRGVPLINVLFLAIVMFPLFVPPGLDFDKLLRALVAFSVFNAAYMAEVFRGGLQAVPAGQYEAARALGLGYGRMMVFVILPQAVRIALPALVNTCIGIFKETTLILIIGLFDFLAVIQAGMADPAWLAGEHIRTSGYVFAAFGFWLFCYGMSRYSRTLERKS